LKDSNGGILKEAAVAFLCLKEGEVLGFVAHEEVMDGLEGGVPGVLCGMCFPSFDEGTGGGCRLSRRRGLGKLEGSGSIRHTIRVRGELPGEPAKMHGSLSAAAPKVPVHELYVS
jgi:hypothetical protein